MTRRLARQRERSEQPDQREDYSARERPIASTVISVRSVSDSAIVSMSETSRPLPLAYRIAPACGKPSGCQRIVE